MKRIFTFIPLLGLLILIGCEEEMAEEDLIGGNWIATAGFQDEDAVGETNCYPFEEGIEFNNENEAYIETFEREFEFALSNENGPPTRLYLDNLKGALYRYEITMLSENEMGITGLGFAEGRSCYLERQ